MPQIFIKDITQGLNPTAASNLNPETPITGLSLSAQDVKPGQVFISVEGTKHDGHSYLDQAIENGAALLVVSKTDKVKNYPHIQVENTRAATSKVASIYYQHPSLQLETIGVTGTNGKTTTNWMIYHLLSLLGKPVARLGTLGFESTINGKVSTREGNLTTPDAISVQKDLYEACLLGAKAVVLELSSHALDQYRVEDLEYNAVIFTNLTRDHLDYHKEMEAYFEAKAKIFTLLKKSSKPNKKAIVNIDNEYGLRMLQRATSLGLDCLTFGENPEALLYVEKFTQDINGSQITLKAFGKTYNSHSRFIGRHNIENTCAAIAACYSLGHTLDEILEAFDKIPQVPGRLESVGTNDIGIFVDYAHTPDALENVIKSLKPLVKGNLWVLFGCGGDRDKGKRPQMAEIVAKFTDKIVVTSDNPRTEDPEEIIRDILASGVNVTVKETDRRTAIRKSVILAKAGDILLIAGKGHENYQEIGTERIHFSDVEEVASALSQV